MIYIILPVHNRFDITKSFILDLKIQEYKDFRLILVDDGSTDGTSEMVQSLLNDSIIIKGDGNLWWAGALDKAYNYIKSINTDPKDVILIINDDTKINRDFLSKAVNSLANKNNLLLKAECYNFDNELIDTGVYIDWRNFTFKNTRVNKEINCVSTRGLFMYVSDFINLGGFYTKLLPHYTSDYEYTYRAYKKGFKLIVDPDLKIFFNDKTTGVSKNSLTKKLSYYYIKKLFSKRTIDNPITLSIFILISSPLKYKLQNILRVWKRTLI